METPYTAVSRKVVLHKCKSKQDNVKSYYGYWWFYSCLIETQGISVWWKETSQTHCIHAFPCLLAKQHEPQSSNAKLLLPTGTCIVTIGIVVSAFTCTAVVCRGTIFVETAVCMYACCCPSVSQRSTQGCREMVQNINH